MAQREKGGRVVFIGNIPYGISEEQIMEIFGRVGQVVGFRLVFDKETQQPKGFGFLEYTDTDAAASAVRNLDGTNNSNQNQNQDSNRAAPPFNTNGQPPPRPDPSALPPLPPGMELPPGVTAFDAISQNMRAYPTPNLIDFISQLKVLCTSNPGQANALFTQAPQLAYASFQAMLLLDLVDANQVHQLLAHFPHAAQPAPPTQPTPSMPPQGMPPGYPAQPQYQVGYPPQGQPPMPPMPQGYPPGYGAQSGYAPTPPQQPAYQPPPQHAPAPQPAAPAGGDENPQALLNKLFAMSRDDIMQSFPDPGTRQQIFNLLAQYGKPV
ncbi:hypothetical protein BST61_g10621 [Cercospora zeina]